MAARVGVEPTTLRLEVINSTNAPPHHVIQTITSEGLAQGPYVAARGGVEPATLCTENIDLHHSTNHTRNCSSMVRQPSLHSSAAAAS